MRRNVWGLAPRALILNQTYITPSLHVQRPNPDDKHDELHVFPGYVYLFLNRNKRLLYVSPLVVNRSVVIRNTELSKPKTRCNTCMCFAQLHSFYLIRVLAVQCTRCNQTLQV
jgi:hypothetical protein